MSVDRDSWLEWRRGGLGASDIAAAWTGLYGGSVAVVADKLGLGPDDAIDPELAERGHRWEKPIADVVHAGYGYYVLGEQLCAEHPDFLHHRATLDGVLHPLPEMTLDEIQDLLEIKTATIFHRPKWFYFRIQTQWQMWVTGAKRVLIAVARVNDHEFEVDRQLSRFEYEWVERNDLLIEQLVDLAERLWGYVIAGELPPLDSGQNLDVVKAMHTEADPSANETVDLEPVADLIAELEDDQALLKDLKDRIGLNEAMIRQAMGSATEGYVSGYRVRCGTPARRLTSDVEPDVLAKYPEYGKVLLDHKRFRHDHPDAYDDFRVPTEDRRLTIKNMEDS